MRIIFWLEDLKGRYHLEGLVVEENIRIDLREVSWEGM
jgi:hypothetical protein